ncbi:ribonuclease H-like domain-containing protein [Tanacetum coccineum]
MVNNPLSQAKFISPHDGGFYVPRNYVYTPSVFQSQATMLPQAFQTMTPQDHSWNMDTGASSYVADNTGILTSFSNSNIYPSIFVGNGQSIPVTQTGHTSHKPLQLNHILVTPHIIKNLIFVHKFTCDNDISVEFDAYGFSVKDYQTGRLLLCCDSTGDLYPVTQQPLFQSPVVLLSFSSTTWHRRLGHPREDVLRKHDKLSFYKSESSVKSFLQRVISSLDAEFSMTDLGSLNYFLGISTQRTSTSMLLSQSKYAEEILERAHMQHCNPCRTLVDTESKLGPDGDPVSDSTLYCSLTGALQYLTFT